MEDGEPVSPSQGAAPDATPCPGHQPGLDSLIRALQTQQSPVVSVKRANESYGEAGAKSSSDQTTCPPNLLMPHSVVESASSDGAKKKKKKDGDRATGRKRKSNGTIVIDEVECGKGVEKEAASRELCLGTIETALSDQRIDSKKAERLRDCIREGNWADVSYRLLLEQIPKKRRGKSGGYQCRVCLVPLKGHMCPYCPVCSTSHIKYLKSESHNCVNCPACFYAGKRRKKVVQISVEGHVCPNANSTS